MYNSYQYIKSTKHAIFTDYPKHGIKSQVFPNDIQFLTMPEWGFKNIKEIDFPKTLIGLEFGHSDVKIIKNTLPEGLKFLILPEEWEFSKTDRLPKSLTHLYFSGSFDQKLSKWKIPRSLTHLHFNDMYNRKIRAGVLPKTLTNLTFGFDFNQKIIENVLPENLTHLEFGNDFNQEINKNVLPKSLTHLTFGWYFNQEINAGVLPPNLTYLELSINFNQSLNFVLPLSLKKLVISNPNYDHPLDFLPESLEMLLITNINLDLSNLPQSTIVQCLYANSPCIHGYKLNHMSILNIKSKL